MLEDVLGSEVFFQGLQKYLKKYSYSNAQTNDLWQSLTQESISSEVNLSFERTVAVTPYYYISINWKGKHCKVEACVHTWK